MAVCDSYDLSPLSINDATQNSLNTGCIGQKVFSCQFVSVNERRKVKPQESLYKRIAYLPGIVRFPQTLISVVCVNHQERLTVKNLCVRPPDGSPMQCLTYRRPAKLACSAAGT